MTTTRDETRDRRAGESLRARGKRQRRERILEAARQLLREDPGQGFTTPQLAELADVAPATVANLVGNRDDLWAALSDEALGSIDPDSLPQDDAQARAWAIVDRLVDVVAGDPDVYRALIRVWGQSASRLVHDPTGDLVACFTAGIEAGEIEAGLGPQRTGELLSSGVIGVMHQWAAGLYGVDSMRRRLRDLVDIAFAAQRKPGAARRTWRTDLT
jgi:AcrR family transcriptional regulator